MNKYMKPLKPTKCDVCGGVVKLVKTSAKNSASGYIYLCTKCGASVGTFKHDKDIAMGTLADKETSQMRIKVHRLFDRFWKGNRTRKNNYRKLASELGIAEEDCHFGLMDMETLKKAEQILLKWWREKYDK